MPNPLLVSTFELTFKPIAPVDSPAARRVAQGYFLTVANTSRSEVTFIARFKIATYDPATLPFDPENTRILTVSNPAGNPGNHDFTFDITGGPLNPVNRRRQTLFGELAPAAPVIPTQLLFVSPRLTLRGGQTGILTLTPKFPFVLPSLEIYGHVELERTSATAVDVLLSANTRGTILPNDFPFGATPGDIDQVAYSLPLATGTALNNF